MKKLIILTAAVMALMAMALPGIALGDTIFVGSFDSGVMRLEGTMAIGAYSDLGSVTHIALNTDNTKLYCALGGNITLLDPATLAVVKTIASGSDIRDMAFKGGSLYALGDGKLLIISDATGEITDEILLGSGEAKKLLLPSSSKAYVVTGTNINIVNLSSKVVENSIALSNTPNDAAISADGSKIFAAGADGKIAVIETAANTASQTIDCATPVKSLTMAKSGALYALTETGDVLSIDTASGAITNKPKVVDNCSGLFESPGGDYLVMLSRSSGMIYKVDASSFGIIAEGGAPLPLAAAITSSDIGTAGVIYSAGVQTIPNQTVDAASLPEGALTEPAAGDGTESLGGEIEPMGAASIVIISPNGGEKWRGTHPIVWVCSFQPLGTCSIYASVDGGNNYNITLATGVPNSGSYSWNTSLLGVDSTQCRISIVARYLSTTVMDTSDNNFTVDNTPPALSVTYPAEGENVVTTGTLTVTGSVPDLTTVALQMRVTGFGTYPDWQTVTVNPADHSFSYPLAIPTSGSATIEVKANDATTPLPGNVTTIIRNININVGYSLLIPKAGNVSPAGFYTTTQDVTPNLTSLACAKILLKLMREDFNPATFPTDTDIYSYKGSGEVELDDVKLAATLNHFDAYASGYYFSMFFSSNFDNYIRNCVWWVSYLVPGVAPNQNIPGCVPLYATAQGYSHWALINGFTSDVEPPETHELSFIVSGLYLTDPAVTGGIGRNFYVASNNLSTYFQLMPVRNEYVAVLEPPPPEFPEVELAPSTTNESTTNLINMAEYANNEGVDPMDRHLLDSAMVVNLEDSAAGFSTGNNLLALFKPEVAKEESKISWKEVIEPTLFLNESFKQAIDNAVTREFIKVHRIDTDKDYYIIPFDKLEAGRYYSYAAIIVDAVDGHFMEASYVEEPTIYVQISKDEAIQKVKESLPDVKDENIEAVLVWEPGGMTLSSFYPYWEVKVGDAKYYVLKKE